jgi:hypothetical protein
MSNRMENPFFSPSDKVCDMKFTCNCDIKYNIIHYFSYSRKHLKSEIYVKNKKYNENQGCIFKNLIDYEKVVIICRCCTYRFLMDNFIFYISEKNQDFIINSIEYRWKKEDD